MSNINVIAAIFEEELKKVVTERKEKKSKKPEYFEEHYLSPEELNKIVEFLKKYLSSTSIDAKGELECILGGGLE